jgi:Outer membrane protein beta-barrel domain
MKKLFGPALIIALFINLDQKCFSQKIVMDARSELQVYASENKAIGKKEIENVPTVFANMKAGKSFGIQYTTFVKKNLFVGGWTSFSEFNNWSADNTLYTGTTMTLFSVGPTLMYKPWSAGNRLTNKLNFCASLSPGISKVKVETSGESQINDGSETNPLEVESLRFTVGLNAGLNYIFTNSFFMTFSAGYQYTVANSEIFIDENYSFINLRAGIGFRFVKDKKYKYSGL